MTKYDEIKDSNSCWNKAKYEERIFVLLGHDVAVPDTIEYWCGARIRMGKNKLEDKQIQEALKCAKEMREEYGGKNANVIKSSKRV